VLGERGRATAQQPQGCQLGAGGAVETATVWLNGAPAGRIELDGELGALSLVVEDGRVTAST
jgi:hypothetical protein